MIAATVVVTVILVTRGPDTSSPQATAAAFVAAINDHDRSAAEGLVCAADKDAAQQVAGGADAGAAGSMPTASHATLVGVDENGDSATMSVSMSVTMPSPAGTGPTTTTVPVSFPLQRDAGGSWLVCGLTAAPGMPTGGSPIAPPTGLVPTGGFPTSGLPTGAFPTGLPGGGIPTGGGLPTGGGVPGIVPTPAQAGTGPVGPQAAPNLADVDRTDASAVVKAWAAAVNAYDPGVVNALTCAQHPFSADDLAAMKAAGSSVTLLGLSTSGDSGTVSMEFHHVPDGPATKTVQKDLTRDASGDWAVC